MTKEDEICFKNLTNCLILFASNYKYLKSLEGPAFDIEFELSTEFDIGLDLDNIKKLYEKGILKLGIKDEILEFREYLISVPDAFWTIHELESNPIWNTVRKKGNNILKQLNMENRGYDFSNVTIV